MTDPFLDLAIANIQRINRWRHDHYANRVLRALRLAPTITIADAMLRGEPVPTTALDPQWRKAYGL